MKTLNITKIDHDEPYKAEIKSFILKYKNLLDDYIANYKIKYLFLFYFILFFVVILVGQLIYFSNIQMISFLIKECDLFLHIVFASWFIIVETVYSFSYYFNLIVLVSMLSTTIFVPSDSLFEE